MNTVGGRLKTLREGVDISQNRMAMQLGLTQSSINRYENGQSEAPYRVLLWYADYFNVSMDYIFGRTDQPQGKLYEGTPSPADPEQWQQFVEACFEPGTPMNAKLKDMMMDLIGGEKG